MQECVMYIMLTKCEFGWTEDEMKRVKEDWRAGVSIEETAAALERPALEVFLLIVDLCERGARAPVLFNSLHFVFRPTKLAFSQHDVHYALFSCVPIEETAAALERPALEVFLLIVDLCERGILKERKGSIYGDKAKCG